MNQQFQLLLCTDNLELIRSAVAAGVDGVIVEWEAIDRESFPLQSQPTVTSEMLESLHRVRRCQDAWVICRLNPFHSHIHEEVTKAIAVGANEIWLPKVRSLKEVETVLNQINNQAHLGIVIETVTAIEISSQLAQLPLRRVHIGVNDLASELKNPHPFLAIADGTIERILANFTVPCGFGGLTLPERGYPFPCRLLMGELTRLRCSFSLLRRSFIADTVGKDLAREISQIKTALHRAATRNYAQIKRDKEEFSQLVGQIISNLPNSP